MTILFPIIYSAAVTYLVGKAFKVMSNGWGISDNENKLTSLIIGSLNGWDITFAGYVMPTGINEIIINSLCMYLFNFEFFFFERFNTQNSVIQYN